MPPGGQPSVSFALLSAPVTSGGTERAGELARHCASCANRRREHDFESGHLTSLALRGGARRSYDLARVG